MSDSVGETTPEERCVHTSSPHAYGSTKESQRSTRSRTYHTTAVRRILIGCKLCSSGDHMVLMTATSVLVTALLATPTSESFAPTVVPMGGEDQFSFIRVLFTLGQQGLRGLAAVHYPSYLLGFAVHLALIFLSCVVDEAKLHAVKSHVLRRWPVEPELVPFPV